MRGLLILLSIWIPSILFANTTQFTLKNGLKILVKEDNRSPIVVSMIWYNVGSADESVGKTGISHILEHLMFKGSASYPTGVFSKTISSLGGQENAFTNYDYTAYFEKLSAKDLAISFALEADRMQNLIFNQEEFNKEIKVIREERRLRTDDNPNALAFERYLASAHLSEAYHHPVIGWMNDLFQINIQEVKTWYKTFYAPNNAVVVVVGDVKPQEIYQLAKKYFGSIPKGASYVRKKTIEPPFLGERKVLINAHTNVPMIILGYTVPSISSLKNNIDPYALEVISTVLDNKDSGRLVKNIIRNKQLASTTNVYYNPYTRYQTQFAIFSTPSAKNSLTELKIALLQEIKTLKSELITDKELNRAKTQLIAQKTFEKDSIFAQATEIGLLEILNLGGQISEDYEKQINKVTKKDILRVSQYYFNKNARTEARLIPKKSTL